MLLFLLNVTCVMYLTSLKYIMEGQELKNLVSHGTPTYVPWMEELLCFRKDYITGNGNAT